MIEVHHATCGDEMAHCLIDRPFATILLMHLPVKEVANSGNGIEQRQKIMIGVGEFDRI
jgi:hypothetical protein